MKSYSVLVGVMLVSGVGVAQEEGTAWAHSKAIYRFESGIEESIVDDSAYGKASLSLKLGAPTTPSPWNHKREFDGVDDVFRVTNAVVTAFGKGDYSIAMWVSGQETNGYRCLFQTGQSPDPSLYVLQHERSVTVYQYGERGAVLTSKIPDKDHAWTHVVVTREQNQLSLNFNGVRSATGVVEVVNYSGSADRSTIGALHYDDDMLIPFAGKMDDVRIYHAALDANENFGLWFFTAADHGWKFDDLDHDQLPDVWETWWADGHGLSRFGKGDYDGDGFSDYEELQGLTSPTSKDQSPTVVFFSDTKGSIPKERNSFWGCYVMRSGNNTWPVGFKIRKSDGVAREGSDFLWGALPNSMPGGEDRVPFSVKVSFDRLREPDETVTFKLGQVKGGLVGKPDTVHLTITSRGPDLDEDGLPDAWEMDAFGSLKYNGRDDPDKDQYSNLMEFYKGMKPHIAWTPDTNDVLLLEILSPVHSVRRTK